MQKKFGLITIVLILVIAFCTTGTVMGMERGRVTVDEKFYKKMEQDYVMQVREYLNEEGYNNSGVTLTKVFFEDGSREYTLNIHHKRIEKLTDIQREKLKQQLTRFAVAEEENEIGMNDILVVFS